MVLTHRISLSLSLALSRSVSDRMSVTSKMSEKRELMIPGIINICDCCLFDCQFPRVQ